MPGPGKLRLVFNPADGGEPIDLTVFDFKGKGVAMSMYNTDEVRAPPSFLSPPYSDIASSQ